MALDTIQSDMLSVLVCATTSSEAMATTPWVIMSLALAPPFVADQLGKHLWREWSDDFREFCSFNSSKDVTRHFMTKNKSGSRCAKCLCRQPSHPITFVAFEKDTEVFLGTASLEISDMGLNHASCGRLWLGNVFVVPQFRNKGLGTTLCKHALDYAKNMCGARLLHLWTFTPDLGAWYEKTFGFKHKCYVCHGRHSNLLVMELALK